MVMFRDLALDGKIPILGKFDEKNQSGLFKMKVGTSNNFNMLNSVVMLIYPALDGKYTV